MVLIVRLRLHVSCPNRYLSLLTEVSKSGETTIDDEAGYEELYFVLQERVDDRSCTKSARVPGRKLGLRISVSGMSVLSHLLWCGRNGLLIVVDQCQR